MIARPHAHTHAGEVVKHSPRPVKKSRPHLTTVTEIDDTRKNNDAPTVGHRSDKPPISSPAGRLGPNCCHASVQAHSNHLHSICGVVRCLVNSYIPNYFRSTSPFWIQQLFVRPSCTVLTFRAPPRHRVIRTTLLNNDNDTGSRTGTKLRRDSAAPSCYNLFI